jgi:hypothetical protein
MQMIIEKLQRASTIKPVRSDRLSSSEWARLMWRWCFKLYQRKRDLIKHAQVFKRTKSIITIDEVVDKKTYQEEEELKKIEANTKHKFVKSNFPKRREEST